MSQTIYKILSDAVWRDAEKSGVFLGSEVDITDGFIHFSTADQVRETAAKHFSGQKGLLLLAVDSSALGELLKYEPSRDGALFPHLYDKLDRSSVKWVRPLPIGDDGMHIFQKLEP